MNKETHMPAEVLMKFEKTKLRPGDVVEVMWDGEVKIAVVKEEPMNFDAFSTLQVVKVIIDDCDYRVTLDNVIKKLPPPITEDIYEVCERLRKEKLAQEGDPEDYRYESPYYDRSTKSISDDKKKLDEYKLIDWVLERVLGPEPVKEETNENEEV